MKSFATKEKRPASTTRRPHSSVHAPLAPVHRLQQNNIRQIVQAKLTIGQPNDTYEQEADRVADHIVANQPAPAISSISGSLATPGVQNIAEESNNDEQIQQKMLQRQPEEEEEELQTKLAQRQADEEEEESIQTKLLQRQPEEEEEEEGELQAKLAQRQADEEEDEPIQTKLVQRQAEEEEEESIQTKLLQRQPEEEEEELQAKLVQRQVEVEEEEEIQAKENPGSSHSTPRPAFQAINNPSSGSSMRPDVRSILESGMATDLSAVRVHEDSTSHEAAASINAKAFTHKNDIWLGAGQSQSDLHLMAHETTHVVQQGGVVRAAPSGISQTSPRVQRFWNPISAAAELVSDAVEWVGDSIGDAINFIKDKASDFVSSMPGYSLFTVVNGRDPISGREVERNGRNFIEAGLDIIPNGASLKQKLEEEGALDEAAQWLDEQINELDISPTEIAGQLSAFWSSLSISDTTRIPTVMDRLLNIIQGPVQRIIRFASNVAARLLEIVKNYLINSLINFIKDHTTAYPLLTVILGRDPISGEVVERTPIALLRGFMLLSESGAEQLRQMEESGSLQKAADWLDGAVARLNLSWEMLVAGFKSIWESVGIQSLLDPGGVFRQIYETFAAPVGRIINFLIEVGFMVLKLIKDALISRLVAYARTIRGYPLLTVILGKDPFSDEPVERSAENIIHGFMSLMDGGEEQFQEMKQTGAIARLTTRIENAIATLNFTWEYIKGLFIRAWESFSLSDLAAPFAAFARLMGIFGEPLGRLISFVGEVIKLVIEVALKLMNFPVALISNIIEKALQAFEDIKRDPIGFLKNLLRAVKTGFVKFFDSIATHLLNGITGWLFKELEDAGVSPPADFSFQSILGFVLDVLGISVDRIFQKLAAKIGQDKVDRMRGMLDRLTGIWTFVSDVMTRGPIAIWEYIQEQLSNLWTIVLDAVRNWVVTRIIQQITVKLLSMLDPTGIMAVVNGFIAFYKAIQSFIAYIREMLEIVNSFVEGVAEIARGSVESAASFLEGSLARAVPIVIGFLANQVGLGGLGRKIGEMIERVRELVDRGLDWLIDKAVSMGTSFMNMLRGGNNDEPAQNEHSPEKQAQIDAGLDTIPTEEARYVQNGKITREDAQRVAASIRQNNSVFSSFNVVDGGDSWNYSYTASAEQIVDTPNTDKAEESTETNTAPDYGGLRHGFGTSALVTYMKSPHTMGGPPGVPNTTDFDAINIRRRGNGSLYVKGHLLNENLGGPGNSWSNLTPLTQQANGDHKRDFENPVKLALNGKLSGLPGEPSNLGWMRDFSVRAIYNNTVNESLISRLLNTDDDVGLDENVDRVDVARILRAEQYVPSSLECSARLFDENGRDLPPSGVVPIDNDISYGQLNQYQLTASPRTRYVLADHFQLMTSPNPGASAAAIRASKVAATQELQQLNGINETIAVAIYDAFSTSGRINNYVRDIGISKQDLEAANTRLRITGGRK